MDAGFSKAVLESSLIDLVLKCQQLRCDLYSKTLTIHDDVIKWKHFCVTSPLWGETAGHRWIPLTKSSDAELWFFSLIYAWTNVWANNRNAGDGTTPKQLCESIHRSGWYYPNKTKHKNTICVVYEIDYVSTRIWKHDKTLHHYWVRVLLMCVFLWKYYNNSSFGAVGASFTLVGYLNLGHT